MKKYYRDENLEAAKLARAHAQAKVNDQEERFKDALDRGVLEQELDTVFESGEYVQGQGIDARELDSVAEEKVHASVSSRSQREIIENSVRKQDTPSLEEIVDYVEGFGIDADQALLHLEKLVRSGKISLPSSIDLSEIEAETEQASEQQLEEESPQEQETDEKGPSTSRREILIEATEEEGPDIDEVIRYAAERGIPPSKAIRGLDKLARSGQVLSVNLGDVEEATERIIGTDRRSNPSQHKSEQQISLQHGRNSKSESKDEDENMGAKQKIMVEAIDSIDSPTKSDIVEYANSYGIEKDKTLEYLEKMIQTGEVVENKDGALRRV